MLLIFSDIYLTDPSVYANQHPRGHLQTASYQRMHIHNIKPSVTFSGRPSPVLGAFVENQTRPDPSEEERWLFHAAPTQPKYQCPRHS